MSKVVFSLGFSKSMALFVLLGHGMAAVLVGMVDLSFLCKGLCLIGLMYSVVQNWQQHVKRRCKGSVVSVWQDSRGRWGCVLRDGRCLMGHLSKQTFQHPYLWIMALKTPQRTFYIPIFRDALDNFGFRTLSTRLSFYEGRSRQRENPQCIYTLSLRNKAWK